MNKLFTKIASLSIGLALAIGVGVVVGGKEARIAKAADTTTTYTFTSKSWAATSGGSAANWTSGKDGGGFSNNGIQVTTGYTGANGTSPKSFTNVTKVIATYNTNKSAGAGSIVVKIGDNEAKTNSVGYSGSSDGRSAKFTSQFDYSTSQTGNIKITVNTTTNSIYLVSVAITESSVTPTSYTVNYYPGTGASGTIPSSTGSSITLKTWNDIKDVVIPPSGKVFTGWKDENETPYEPGQTGITSNLNLYAQWETAYTVTYDANGGTGELTDPNSPYLAGSTVTVLPNSFTKGSDTFDHWDLAADGSGADYDPNDTFTINSNTKLYAIWTPFTPVGGEDTLTRETTGVSGTSYSNWSGKTVTSSAIYAGNSAGGNDSIQLRSNNNESGIISTRTGGYIRSITVAWNSNTSNDRTIDIYGKNSAYSAASDLYSAESTTQGTKLGSITYGTSTSLKIEGDYSFVGVRSNNGALYLDSITFTWEVPSTDPEVIISSAESTKTISKMKSESDDNVRVTLKNIEDETDWTFTFDEGGSIGLATSSYVSVKQASTEEDHVYKLNISLDAVGSTVIHINVDGTDCADTISVTVNYRPATLKLFNGDTEVTGSTMEIMTGGSAKNISFKYVDTESPAGTHDIDNNLITSVSSEPSKLRLSGGDVNLVLNPDAAGENIVVTCTITSTSEWDTPVTATLTVNIIDDYLESVQDGGVTFNTGLSANQGDSPTLAVFATRVGKTHFGSPVDIPLEDFRFSYVDELGATAEQFGYDFSHGEDVDPTHKSQTIYVYCTLGNVKVGTYSVTVKQVDDPLTAITLSTDAANITRTKTLQLEWTYTAQSGGHNPTDGKGVLFSISDASSGSEISVNASGLVSAGSVPEATATVTITSDHNPNIKDSIAITVTMDSMTYTASVGESWTKAENISVGDEVIIVNETASRELTEINSKDIGVATTYTTAPSHSFILTVGAGNAEDSFTLSNDGAYLAYTNSSTTKNNNLFTISDPTTDDELNQVSWEIEISNGDATITNVYNTNRQLQYNATSGQERFCCYATAQTAVQIYKKTAGYTEMTVDATLFNGVHSNFGGEGKTYEWDESCSNFDSDAWEEACTALKGITGYSTYKLNRAVGNMLGNEIEQFIAKYDIIIGKVGKTYDYLSRFSSGGINAAVAIGNNTLHLSMKNTSATIIVVVISAISAASIGGYFLFRKKKED